MAKTGNFVVVWETASSRGKRRFWGPAAHQHAGDYAREIASWLVQYAAGYLHIEQSDNIDAHTRRPYICSSYSWTKGRGWYRLRGAAIKGFEQREQRAAA